MVKKKTKKKTRRTPGIKDAKIITVAVMGRPAQAYPLSAKTKAKDVAKGMEIDYRSVQASKNGTTDFKEIKDTTVVNGYKALLFVPQVDGGN